MIQWIRNLNNKLTQFLDSPVHAGAGLAASIAAFLALTLTRLTSSSIWLDEGFSTLIARRSFGEIFHYTAVDVHPPLYYWLLKIWTSLFGTSDAAFRSMSVFFGIIALVLVYILVKQLFKRQTALLATFFVAISPMFVRYGIEARMYMVVIAICLAATLMLLRAQRTQQMRDYVIYGLLVALGMWTHYFTVVVWLAHWVYRLIYLRSQRTPRSKLARSFFSKQWLVAHAVAIGLFLPWAPFALHQMSGLAGGFWIPPVTLNTAGDLWGDVLFYLEGGRADGWIAVAGLAVLAIMVYLLYRLWPKLDRTEQLNLRLVLIMAVAPILFLVALSLWPFKSVFIDRYLMTSIVFIYILMTVTIRLARQYHITPRWLPNVATILVLGCFVFGITRVYYYGNYNRNATADNKQTMTKELVKAINEDNHAAAPIIVNHPYMYFEAFNYATTDHPVYYLKSQVMADDLIKIGSLDMLRDDTSQAINDINKFIKDHSLVWIIGNTNNNEVTIDGMDQHWRKVKAIGAPDRVSGHTGYWATLYQYQE